MVEQEHQSVLAERVLHTTRSFLQLCLLALSREAGLLKAL